MNSRSRAENWSRNALPDYNKKYSAKHLRDVSYIKFYIIILLFAAYTYITGYVGFVLALNLFSFSYFVYRLILFIIALKRDNNNINIKLYELPTYCILLPLKNEPLELVNKLIANISKLNYDKSKLDVILLIDEGDKILNENMEMPSHFRIISARNLAPFTKPKSCNLGLYHTDAEIITIYDAEDKPDPDQLLRVVDKFKQDEELQCVQCELHFKNDNGNLLTAFFALEYLVWFTFLIKGLGRSMKVPFIPLGGTSQHIKSNFLKKIGGWDAYNVTEDADLGLRILREKGKIATLESSTYEIAPSSITGWIKQRTRWNLGYLITIIIHTQDLRKLVKEIGLYRSFHVVVNLLFSVIHSVITPVLIGIFIASFFYKTNTYIDTMPKITLIANYMIIVLSSAISTIRKGEFRFILCVLFPFYYLLHPIAAIRSVYKLYTAPYHWEKTCKKDFIIKQV